MQFKRTGVYSRQQLTRLLHPQSVAVIGASTRAGSFGKQVLANLVHYAGRAYPVNARYETIDGQTCYPKVLDLP
jgi:acetate---CoA ligase (ADP-forming)